MADKRIYELTEASTVGSSDVLALDSQNMAQTKKVKVKTITDPLSDKNDITSLNLTGSTNTSGGTIEAGRYFYLNGDLVKAKTDIAAGATFTAGTNYMAAYVGTDLADVKQTLSQKYVIKTNSAHVQVTADGVKTIQAILNEVTNSLLSLCQSLSAGEALRIIDLQYVNGQDYAARYPHIYYDRNTTAINRAYDFMGVAGGTDMRTYLGTCTGSSTLENCNSFRAQIQTSGTTYTFNDETSVVPDSGKYIRVYYEIIKQI